MIRAMEELSQKEANLFLRKEPGGGDREIRIKRRKCFARKLADKAPESHEIVKDI